MAILALDLGGTKLALAVLDENGKVLTRGVVSLHQRKGREVGELITQLITSTLSSGSDSGFKFEAIGIAVPGIYRSKSGTVWAPNIPDWEDYPLLEEVKKIAGTIPVVIESDRACYILSEVWLGNAKECSNAIFLAVGTGIGAGILADGKVLRGSHDIAGAIGWMALQRPFDENFKKCGCFEYYASGEGVARLAKMMVEQEIGYDGILKLDSDGYISSRQVFFAFQKKDELAIKIIKRCVEYWGMACANLVSLYNPEKIIFGGGIFGPAVSLIPQIKEEAKKWAQPVSMTMVSFEASSLGNDAGVYGAGYLALQYLKTNSAN